MAIISIHSPDLKVPIEIDLHHRCDEADDGRCIGMFATAFYVQADGTKRGYCATHAVGCIDGDGI